MSRTRAQDGMPDRWRDRTIVVTGGSGYLGRFVLRDLARRFPGRIIAIHRTPLASTGARLAAPHREVLADLRNVDEWTPYLRDADYVLWLAALRDHGAPLPTVLRENVTPLRAALDVLVEPGRLSRFIFASTISALDQPTGVRNPQPLFDGSPPNPRTPYGYSKLESERLIAGSGVPYTILRFPFLLGPAFRAKSFLDFYRMVARNPVLSRVRFTGNLSLLYTGDVANLLLQIMKAEHAATDGSPYVVSDGEVYDVDELISLVAAECGVPRPRVRAPASVGRLLSSLALASSRVAGHEVRPRSAVSLIATYWAHAAFTRDYFVVNPTRFLSSFGPLEFTPIADAIHHSFSPVTPPGVAAA